MKKETVYLAVDLGAGSGRIIAGRVMGDRLELEEMHRFVTYSEQLNGGLYWDIAQIFGEIKEGIKKAYKQFGNSIKSLGVDTWGVDYAFLDEQGHLIGLPYQYRDPRTEGIGERIAAIIPKEEVFAETGVVFLFLNTLYQIKAEVDSQHPRLKIAAHMLFIPDLINYMLTGVIGVERTIASTSQMLNVHTGEWAVDMLKKLGIPTGMLGEIIEPGTLIGGLLPEVQAEIGGDIPVYAVGGHDTASAAAAVPATANDHVYMSSGTWSLMGVEIEKPITDPAALNFGVTNEVAIDRKIRFQKNIAGMWLIMECKRIWEDEGKNYDYGELVHLAENAEPFRSLFNPDDPVFTTPGDMPSRIKEQCRKHGEPVPETPGQVARAIYESLALRYRHTFEALERLTGKSYARLHIVGGGARNALLNQFTADALNRPVHAGPYEATSAGNIVVQMMASGEVQDLTAARKVVASSFGMATILPRDAQPWEEAYTRFLKLIEG